MTASGPFAMGPAMAGASAQRTAPRTNFTPVAPQGPGAAAKLGLGLTQTVAPSLGVKREGKAVAVGEGSTKKADEEEEKEVYSDADEGVEIIDMEDVKTMDWMAPEALKKARENKKKKVKIEEHDKKAKGKLLRKTFAFGGVLSGTGVAKEESTKSDQAGESTGVNLANAVDLSESEEEEELEDIIDDFNIVMNADTVRYIFRVAYPTWHLT